MFSDTTTEPECQARRGRRSRPFPLPSSLSLCCSGRERLIRRYEFQQEGRGRCGHPQGRPDECFSRRSAESQNCLITIPNIDNTSYNSASIQYITRVAAKMPHPPHQDRAPPLHGREIPHQRSHLPLLRYLQAIPEQRCLAPADGVFGHQGVGADGGGCDYGDEQYYEGYCSGGQRCDLSRECYPESVSDY